MSFLAPVWLGVAFVGAALTTALHFLSRSRPRSRVLPTTRFVPAASVRTLAPAPRATDLSLLVLRIVSLLLIGAALARPVWRTARPSPAIIALADGSAGADSQAVASAMRVRRPRPDTVIWFKSLSTGLVGARRAGARLASRADSVELVVISSFAAGLWDAATTSIRQTWPGRVRLVGEPVRAPEGAAVEIDTDPDDALRAALDRLERRGGRAIVLVRRHRPSAEDSARVRGRGGVLLIWPRAEPGARGQTNAVLAAGVAVVGPMVRFAAPSGSPISHFADGAVAAGERPLGIGCEREVAFSLDAGDALLRPAGLRLVQRLIAPCGDGWTPDGYAPLDSARLASLEGTGGAAPASALRDDRPRPPAAIPLVLAGLALAVERMARRKRAKSPADLP
ncbi:MAG: BatA domain-containing protein [Gemmatimonadetes bacterium]|nr:BatA domain-containing protein [Gemmatimonadota bacterium]